MLIFGIAGLLHRTQKLASLTVIEHFIGYAREFDPVVPLAYSILDLT